MIPQPKQSKLTDEKHRYSLHIVSLSPEFTAAADRLCEYAQKAHGLSFTRGEDGIVLEKDSSLDESRYRLECGEKVILKAGSLQGAHWGFATLLQLMTPEGEGFSCPEGTVEDWPDVPHR